MNFLDLFAGIGGFRLGMERAGHKCVGYCEIDKYARLSYNAIHNTEGEIDYKDITEVTNEEFRKLRGKVDVICGGFPCQAFSIAGNQLGFEDARGTLFYEIARAAEQVKPRYLFLENVRNLLSHDKGKTFARMLKILDELGYDAEWQVLNSKNFGVPQNRERVFIIAHLRGERTSRVFPIRGKDEKFNTDGEINQVGNIGKSDNFGGNPQVTRVYDINGISPTLNTMQGGGREPKILVKEATKQGYAVADVGDSINFSHPNSKTRRGRVGKNIANTLLTSDEQGVVLSDYKIRKLTPRECWRLQGFPDWAFDKAQEVNSNSQLYKQAGNSVTVNVIEEIAKRLR
jgi:DNA (cytosine-5-)-methyltransferase